MNRRNLLPVARAWAKRRARAKRRWVTLDLLYAAALATAGLLYYGSVSDDTTDADAREAAAQVTQLTSTLAGARQQVAALDATEKSMQEVTGRPDWSVLLAVLGKQAGDDVVLLGVDCSTTSTAADATPQACGLTGVGRSQGAVTQFVLRLERLGLFSHVRLTQTAPQSAGGVDGVGFQVVCDLPGGGRS